MIIAAIDPGRVTGIAVADVSMDGKMAWYTATVRVMDLSEYAREIRHILVAYRPRHVIVERQFRHRESIERSAIAYAAAALLTPRPTLVWANPNEWRGRLPSGKDYGFRKSQIKRLARIYLKARPRNQHESDAVWMVYWYISANGLRRMGQDEERTGS